MRNLWRGRDTGSSTQNTASARKEVIPHRASSTTRRNFFVVVQGTPLSICSQTVWWICSPWSSHRGLPRFWCSAQNVSCAWRRYEQVQVLAEMSLIRSTHHAMKHMGCSPLGRIREWQEKGEHSHSRYNSDVYWPPIPV